MKDRNRYTLKRQLYNLSADSHRQDLTRHADVNLQLICYNV